MIAAADAEDDPAVGEDVGHRVIFRQAQRVPHRGDVEAAADIDVFRDMRQVQRHQQHVGNALGAFALEVMLGHPEGVVAEAIHLLRDRLCLPQRA